MLVKARGSSHHMAHHHSRYGGEQGDAESRDWVLPLGYGKTGDQARAKEGHGQWVASFAEWYNHRHRHSGINFVTPLAPQW